MKTLLFKSAKSRFSKSDGSPVWQGIPQPGKPKTQADLYAESARQAHMDVADIAYVDQKMRGVLIAFLLDGYPVVLDWFGLNYAFTGPLDSADDDFDPNRNSIVVRAYSRPPLRDCHSEMKVRNVTSGLKASILSVTDNAAMEENVITVPSKVLVAGNNILVNIENQDEGCWLAKKNGDIIAAAQILANDASSLDLAFAELPPDGEYVLVVKARSGASTDYAPAIARRTVTVRSAA